MGGWFSFTTGVDTTNLLAGLKVDAEDISFTLEEVATATTLTANHFLVMVNGNVTITLPAAASHANRVYTIKNIGTGKVTIYADGSEKIDGEQTLVLNLQYSYVTIVSDGDEWFIIGGRNVKLEDLFEDKMDELADLLSRILIEAQQQTLHQASESDEPVEPGDKVDA